MARIIISIVLFLGLNYGFANVGWGQDSTSSKTTKLKNKMKGQSDTSSAKKDSMLKKFRKAFKKVINKQQHNASEKASVDSVASLNIGILILDQTRTKMGRDFYSLFYQEWQDPANAPNFTITINERPSPGLGSIVEIKIDNDKVYSSRLQPKFQYLKALSKQAVNRCEQIIQRKAKVRQQLSGY